MAITKALNEAKKAQEANQQAPAPQAAPKPQAAPQPTAKVGGSAKEAKTEAFRAEGKAVRASMTEDQKAIEGSKKDTVEFLCTLGDPSVSQKIMQKGTYIPGYRVVGYKVRVSEDTEIPYAPLNENPKSELDVAPATTRQVKAGEVVDLNIIETAMMISKLEYAGQFTGGGKGVYIYPVASDNSSVIRPALRKMGDGSIKDNMELIADMQGGDGKTVAGGARPVLKPEYEATFKNLYSRKAASKGAGTSATGTVDKQADYAAAFRKLYGM